MQRLPVQAPSSVLPSASTTSGRTPKKGRVAEPGLSGGRAGQRGDHDSAGLGLPPGIDDRAAPVAHDVVVPEPGLGVDRLADRAQQAERGPVGRLHRAVALAHQGADRGRGGIEDVDLVLVADLPEARRVGVVGQPLEHQRRRAVGERAVNDVAVPGDPANVGGAPVDFAIAVVEDVLVRHRGVDHVAAGGVQHPLRLSGRARSVEDEERILGAHRLGRAVLRRPLHRLVVPDVAPRPPSRSRRRYGGPRCISRSTGRIRAPCRHCP